MYRAISYTVRALIAFNTLTAVLTAQSPVRSTGSITEGAVNCTSNSACVSLTSIPPNFLTTVQASGDFAGDFVFEGTIDGQQWFIVPGVRIGASSPLALKPVLGPAAPGAWKISATGLSGLRVRASRLDRGGANIVITASPASSY